MDMQEVQIFVDLFALGFFVVVICLMVFFCKWFHLFMKRRRFFYELEIGSLCKRRQVKGHEEEEHEKKNDNEEKAWWHQAKIYHLLIDRFNGGWTTPPESKDRFVGGTLKGVTEKLDYISGLGFNSIMLSPFFKSKAYHGYHTLAYDEIDCHFGSWSDLYELIDAAHKKKLKVICDFVPNHCHEENPIFKESLSPLKRKTRKWFYYKGIVSSDYISFLHYNHLPKFNLHNEETAEYLINVAEMLIYCGVDGIRIDHVIGLPFDFLKNLQNRIKAINPEVFVFGEATAFSIKEFSQIEFISERHRELAEKGELSRDELQKQYIGVIDGVLDFEYRRFLISEIEKGHRFMGNLELIRKLQRHFAEYPRNFSPVLFLDNHDLDRFMYFCNGDKTLLDEAVEFTRSLPYPFTYYYGTEQYMTNDPSIINAEPYADLRVRLPMDWSNQSRRL